MLDACILHNLRKGSSLHLLKHRAIHYVASCLTPDKLHRANKRMAAEVKEPDGLRARKRRETRKRIAESGLELFVSRGYGQTTIDEIAASAEISRRTFFYYFKSKEDILLTRYDGLLEELRAEVLKEPTDQIPFDAAQKCLLRMASRYVTEGTVAVDRLLRSTEALRNRKEAFHREMEEVLTKALCEMWPSREEHSLRLVAMIVTGTVRISQSSWRHDEGKYPLTHYLKRNFALLKRQF